MSMPGLPKYMNVGGADLRAYRDFKARHGRTFYVHPSGQCISATNYRFRFEIQWFSENPQILYKFGEMLGNEYGEPGECTDIMFTEKPITRFNHDRTTGMTVCSDNLAIHQNCLEMFCRAVKEVNESSVEELDSTLSGNMEISDD